ncbi:MAG: hypothetical protein OXE02_06225 [Chloroflexi bacterium]|nr:hypothetical protein [Chloroflexota bacterium]
MDNGLQKGRVVDLWRAVAQTDELVDFFTGMFEVMGITIEETGEELTVRVGEGKVHIEPGLPDRCDFLVPLKMENVTNMVSHAADGRLDAFETWRIASVLFTPLTRETLKNPMMSRGILRRLARVEDLIHVRLLGPEAEQVASHTLVFAGGQWLVIEGLHGQARRKFSMTGEECVTYQKQVFKAMKANSIMGWIRFARWYGKWRPSASA